MGLGLIRGGSQVAVAVLVASAAALATSAALAQPLTPILLTTSARCPERPVLEEALARRGLGATPGGTRFRLSLAGTDGEVDVTLRDDDGEVLLARTLATQECAALADTIAMLVERRIGGIAWRAPAVAPPELPAQPEPEPPPPPAPPTPSPPRRAPPPSPAARVVHVAQPARPWAADVQVGGMFATGFAELSGAPGPALALALRPPQPVSLRLALGWMAHDGIPVGTGQARIDRVPIALAGTWSLRRHRVELDLGLVAELELLFTATRDIPAAGSDDRVSLRGGPTASLGVEIGPSIWLSLHADALAVLSGWDFVVVPGADPAQHTHVASQVAALEVGLTLGFRLGHVPN